MDTGGTWGLVSLFAFVIISVLLFKLLMHAVGQDHIAALV